MKWKFMKLFCLSFVFLFVILSIFAIPINIIKASNEFDPSTYVKFGVYSSTQDGIVESDSIRFENHVLYGLSLGIYNYFSTSYGSNQNYPVDFTVIRSRLSNALGEEFWSNVSTYRFLCNAYRYTTVGNQALNYIILAFNRASYDSGELFDRRVNMSDLVTFEILPEAYNGGRYFFVDVSTNSNKIYRLFNILPYYNRNDLGIASSSYIESNKAPVTLQDIIDGMVSQTVRSFYIILQITTPSIGISVLSDPRLNAYLNDSTFSGIIQNYDMYQVVPIMCDYPVYSFDNVAYTSSSAFMYNKYPNNNNVFQLFYNRLPEVYWNENMSPILISGYEYIPNVTPTPTSTPTPVPTWTPFPTATPFPPVNEIEGIGQMMTLFTRKYEININGNVFGIRPLYLFVFCVLVGTIFSAVQGGDRS